MRLLSRIDPFSLMKVGGIIYGCLGLLFGAIFTIFFTLGMTLGSIAGQQDMPFRGIWGFLFGMLGIVVFPIFYGVLGALMAGLMAVLYNFVARRFGGVVFEVRETKEPLYGAPVSPAIS